MAKLRTLISGLVFTTVVAQAAPPKGGCFDFAEPRKTPLKDPFPLVPGEDKVEKGDLPNDLFWGAARGVVHQPLRDVYKLLLNHYNWKSPSKHNLKTFVEKKPGILEFHRVEVEYTGLVFISLDWEEEWAYQLVEGTEADPKTMVISYQKSAGTSHLEHLCGTVQLKKQGETTTDVFLYEEVKATRGGKDDVAKAHLGTLTTLRSVSAFK